ncbi:MAG: hypothetical protein MUO72_08745 [Bacteroidales bacterium]|nr:hypothetical protein [Bacteroidales bacterium]
MDQKQLKDAERIYQSWSETQLIKATKFDKQGYEPEALDLLAREISRRNNRNQTGIISRRKY